MSSDHPLTVRTASMQRPPPPAGQRHSVWVVNQPPAPSNIYVGANEEVVATDGPSSSSHPARPVLTRSVPVPATGSGAAAATARPPAGLSATRTFSVNRNPVPDPRDGPVDPNAPPIRKRGRPRNTLINIHNPPQIGQPLLADKRVRPPQATLSAPTFADLPLQPGAARVYALEQERQQKLSDKIAEAFERKRVAWMNNRRFDDQLISNPHMAKPLYKRPPAQMSRAEAESIRLGSRLLNNGIIKHKDHNDANSNEQHLVVHIPSTSSSSSPVVVTTAEKRSVPRTVSTGGLPKGTIRRAPPQPQQPINYPAPPPIPVVRVPQSQEERAAEARKLHIAAHQRATAASTSAASAHPSRATSLDKNEEHLLSPKTIQYGDKILSRLPSEKGVQRFKVLGTAHSPVAAKQPHRPPIHPIERIIQNGRIVYIKKRMTEGGSAEGSVEPDSPSPEPGVKPDQAPSTPSQLPPGHAVHYTPMVRYTQTQLHTSTPPGTITSSLPKKVVTAQVLTPSGCTVPVRMELPVPAPPPTQVPMLPDPPRRKNPRKEAHQIDDNDDLVVGIVEPERRIRKPPKIKTPEELAALQAAREAREAANKPKRGRPRKERDPNAPVKEKQPIGRPRKHPKPSPEELEEKERRRKEREEQMADANRRSRSRKKYVGGLPWIKKRNAEKAAQKAAEEAAAADKVAEKPGALNATVDTGLEESAPSSPVRVVGEEERIESDNEAAPALDIGSPIALGSPVAHGSHMGDSTDDEAPRLEMAPLLEPEEVHEEEEENAMEPSSEADYSYDEPMFEMDPIQPSTASTASPSLVDDSPAVVAKTAEPVAPAIALEAKASELVVSSIAVDAKIAEPVAPSIEVEAMSSEPLAPSTEVEAMSSEPVAPSIEVEAMSSEPVAPSIEIEAMSSEPVAPSIAVAKAAEPIAVVVEPSAADEHTALLQAVFDVIEKEQAEERDAERIEDVEIPLEEEPPVKRARVEEEAEAIVRELTPEPVELPEVFVTCDVDLCRTEELEETAVCHDVRREVEEQKAVHAPINEDIDASCAFERPHEELGSETLLVEKVNSLADLSCAAPTEVEDIDVSCAFERPHEELGSETLLVEKVNSMADLSCAASTEVYEAVDLAFSRADESAEDGTTLAIPRVDQEELSTKASTDVAIEISPAFCLPEEVEECERVFADAHRARVSESIRMLRRDLFRLPPFEVIFAAPEGEEDRIDAPPAAPTRRQHEPEVCMSDVEDASLARECAVADTIDLRLDESTICSEDKEEIVHRDTMRYVKTEWGVEGPFPAGHAEEREREQRLEADTARMERRRRRLAELANGGPFRDEDGWDEGDALNDDLVDAQLRRDVRDAVDRKQRIVKAVMDGEPVDEIVTEEESCESPNTMFATGSLVDRLLRETELIYNRDHHGKIRSFVRRAIDGLLYGTPSGSFNPKLLVCDMASQLIRAVDETTIDEELNEMARGKIVGHELSPLLVPPHLLAILPDHSLRSRLEKAIARFDVMGDVVTRRGQIVCERLEAIEACTKIPLTERQYICCERITMQLQAAMVRLSVLRCRQALFSPWKCLMWSEANEDELSQVNFSLAVFGMQSNRCESYISVRDRVQQDLDACEVYEQSRIDAAMARHFNATAATRRMENAIAALRCSDLDPRLTALRDKWRLVPFFEDDTNSLNLSSLLPSFDMLFREDGWQFLTPAERFAIVELVAKLYFETGVVPFESPVDDPLGQVEMRIGTALVEIKEKQHDILSESICGMARRFSCPLTRALAIAFHQHTMNAKLWKHAADTVYTCLQQYEELRENLPECDVECAMPSHTFCCCVEQYFVASSVRCSLDPPVKLDRSLVHDWNKERADALVDFDIGQPIDVAPRVMLGPDPLDEIPPKGSGVFEHLRFWQLVRQRVETCEMLKQPVYDGAADRILRNRRPRSPPTSVKARRTRSADADVERSVKTRYGELWDKARVHVLMSEGEPVFADEDSTASTEAFYGQQECMSPVSIADPFTDWDDETAEQRAMREVEEEREREQAMAEIAFPTPHIVPFDFPFVASRLVPPPPKGGGRNPMDDADTEPEDEGEEEEVVEEEVEEEEAQQEVVEQPAEQDPSVEQNMEEARPVSVNSSDVDVGRYTPIWSSDERVSPMPEEEPEEEEQEKEKAEESGRKRLRTRRARGEKEDRSSSSTRSEQPKRAALRERTEEPVGQQEEEATASGLRSRTRSRAPKE